MVRDAVPCRFPGGFARSAPLVAGLLILVAFMVLPDVASAAQQGPVAAYSFDAGEGTTVEDVTGDGHEGTIEGAGWTGHGKFGDALSFDGEEGCVSIPDSETLQLTEEFTLEAWVRSEGGGHDDPIIFKESTAGSGDGENPYSLYVGLGEDNRIEGFLGEEGEGGQAAVADPELLPRDVWTHVALTYDGARMRLYVDGELVDTTAAIAPEASTGPLLIGCDGVEGIFHGRIDEVRIYERALGEREVDTDMTAPLQTPASGPVAAFSFDEGEGTTAGDATGDGHEGTVEGAAWTRGRYGDALEFSGNANECVSVPDSEDLKLSEEFTLEAWVKGFAPLEEDPIIYKEHLGEEGFGNVGYSLGIGLLSDGRPEGFIGEGGGAFTDAGADAIEAGVWTHLAFTYDGRHMRIYENGELAGENTQTTGPLAAGGPLKIGCDGSYGNNFDGRIDEVRLYDRALGEGEVGADMEAPIQTPKQGPVAAYSFDEGEGTTAEDASGNGHEGTIEGAGWTRGRYGDALRFVQNEGRQCVTVADSPDLRLEEEFTLEAWVRPEEWLGSSSIVSKELEPGSDQSYSLGIGFTEYGRVEGWSENEVVYSPEPIEEDVWTHVAYTYDGRRARIYLDGELVSDKAVGPRELASTGPLDIGCDSPSLGAQFFGRIDEVRLYDRALDEGEVDTDMEAPIQTPRQGPIAAYSFDEGEGTTVEDLTGDGHTATIHGAGWTTHGRYGGAMEFDAAGEGYLSIPDSPELDLTEEFTLEAWVRPGSESNEWAPIIAKETGGGEASHELAYWLYEGDWESNQPYGGTEPAPGEKDKAHAEDPLPVDVWSHLALTYDGAKVRLYVDGELVGCSPAPAGPPPVTGGELQIGGASELGDFFTGRIDEARIYNRALNEAEIKASMQPLPEVGTAEPYGVEDTEAVMAATVNPRNQETTYKFQYGPTKRYGTVVPEEPEEVFTGNEPLEVEEVAEELLPETTYHYRVIAHSDAGTTVGPDQTLTTGPEVSPEEGEEELHLLAKKSWKGFFNLDWSGKSYEIKEEMNMVEKAGGTTFRYAFSPDLGKVDEYFEAAAEHHIRILPDLSGNRIESKDPETGTRKHWLARVEAALERYGDNGTFWTSHPGLPKLVPEYWEVWNEENYGANGNQAGQVDPAQFAELLKETHDLFERVDPGAKIMLGGLLTVSKENNGSAHLTVGSYLHELNHYGASPYYEAVSLHPYAFKGDVQRISKQVMRNISKTRKALDKIGGAGKKIWVTEIGWPVDGPQNDKLHLSVSEKKQAELVESVFRRIKERAGSGSKGLGIEKAFYYNVQNNFFGVPHDWSMHCGLREDAAKVHETNETVKATPEHGKYRKSWYAFQEKAESSFLGKFP